MSEILKHLVMKLWKKSDDRGSQVVGFTTIDLRPLLAGMPEICGWYNIVDFTGLCQGQIKCGVIPLAPLTDGMKQKRQSQDYQITDRRFFDTQIDTAVSNTSISLYLRKQ